MKLAFHCHADSSRALPKPVSNIKPIQDSTEVKMRFAERSHNLNLVSSDRAAKTPLLLNGNPLPVNSDAFKTDHGQRYSRRRK